MGRATDITSLCKRVVYRSTYGGGVQIPLEGSVVNEYVLSRSGTDPKGNYVEYVFEEAGKITTYSWNFWDPSKHNDGWVRIYPVSGTIEIISCNCGGDNQLWIDNKPAFGPDPTNKMHTQMKPNVGKTINLGAGVSGTSSYGINSFAHRYSYGSPVLVLMDYEADGATLAADPDDPARVRQQLLNSLRHLGRVNMLLADGSVRTAGLSQIDPVANRRLWNPDNLAPHADD
jgi:prepilin-type processing-associated H-X9-DG protein